jgi:hypothetical protein
MKKALIAAAVALALAASAVMPTTAEAQSRRFWQGLAVGAGAAIVGSALFGAAARAHIDPRWHGYAPVEGYYYYPGYAAAPLAPCPGGFWGARVVGHAPSGAPIYGKARWVCPPPGYAYTNYYYR